MNEKELQKMNRRQLLELLLQQTEKMEQLEAQVDGLNRKLQSRVLLEEKAGSIAEAALKLNGVFNAAQAAADQYLNNIKLLSENQQLLFDQAEAECQKKTEKMLAEAEEYCTERKAEADRLLEEARALLLFANKKNKKS